MQIEIIHKPTVTTKFPLTKIFPHTNYKKVSSSFTVSQIFFNLFFHRVPNAYSNSIYIYIKKIFVFSLRIPLYCLALYIIKMCVFGRHTPCQIGLIEWNISILIFQTANYQNRRMGSWEDCVSEHVFLVRCCVCSCICCLFFYFCSFRRALALFHTRNLVLRFYCLLSSGI